MSLGESAIYDDTFYGGGPAGQYAYPGIAVDLLPRGTRDLYNFDPLFDVNAYAARTELTGTPDDVSSGAVPVAETAPTAARDNVLATTAPAVPGSQLLWPLVIVAVALLLAR